MKLLQRTHENAPRYFFEGKRIDNHTFRNLLSLTVRNGIEPEETKDKHGVMFTAWNVESLSEKEILIAKSKAFHEPIEEAKD